MIGALEDQTLGFALIELDEAIEILALVAHIEVAGKTLRRHQIARFVADEARPLAWIEGHGRDQQGGE